MKRYFYFLLLLLICSCEKSSFLQENPSDNFVRPTTLDQCWGLLNNPDVMGPTPVYGEQSADDYRLPAARYALFSHVDKNLYTWQKDIYQGSGNIPDWDIAYKQLFIISTVLESPAMMVPGTDSLEKWKHVRGFSLFMRSYIFHNLAQVFAPVYRPGEAGIQKGVVLQVSTLFAKNTARASLESTYRRIITDLQEAIPLLPAERPATYRNLPCKAAGYALLARIYLSMRDYTPAGVYADSCLQTQAVLMDYNVCLNNSGVKFVFPATNDEVLYRSWLIESNVIRANAFKDITMAPDLYQLYDSNDLRRSLFFERNDAGEPFYRNSYAGNVYAFSGLAVDEMYLVKAECLARAGKITEAMALINALLGKRYLTGTFTNKTAVDMATALKIIWEERRKELVFRGLRWQDLRRRNEEGAGIELARHGGNQLYQLLPKSINYVLPIPEDARKGSAIEQNERE